MADNQNDIGGKVGLDITDFKANIGELNRQIKVIDSGFKAAAAGMDDWGSSEEGLQSKIKSLNEITDLQRQKVQNLTAEYQKISAEKGENSRAAQNLQIQINKETESLNKNESELKKNVTALDDIGKEADSSSGDLKKAGEAAEDSGKKAEGSHSGWSKLGGGIAAAGEVAAKAAAAMGAAALTAGTALVGASVSAAAYADDILTTAAQTGIATDKLQEYKYATELVDVPVETLTKSMAKQIKSMKSAQDGSDKTVDAYKKLGVTVTNADGSLRDGQTVYWEIIDSLGKMKNETERDALSMQLLGKSAQELNPLIEVGAEKMNELGKQAHDAGYVLGEDALKAFGDFDDQLQYLKVGAEGAKNALGTVLLPVLTNLAGNGVDMLGQFTKGIVEANGDMGKIGEVVSGLVSQVTGTIMQLLPTILDTGVKILGAIGKGIVDNLPTLIDAAINVIMTIVNGIIGALPQLVAGALQIIIALAQGLITSLPKLIPAVIEAIMTIVKTLTENLPMIIEGAVQIILSLAQGIIKALPDLIPAVVQAILTIVQSLVDNLPTIIEAAIQIILALVQGIINALPKLLEQAPKIISTIINGIVNALPQLIDAAIKIIMAIVDFLLDPKNLDLIIKASIDIVIAIAKGLVQAVPQLLVGVVQLIAELIKKFGDTDWSELGKNIIDGIIEGLKNGAKAIGDAAKNTAKNALEAAEKFLGINSPSKVFREKVGYQIPAGAALGINDGQKKVKAAMQSLNEEIVKPQKPKPRSSNGGSTDQSGEGNIYVDVPLSIDGQVVTKKTSRYQYRNNTKYSRSKGVVPT